ncbi:MAG: hypothetical protein J6386_20380 [Candidatus Synoicihabitans palmerolidicus]|nr:hypothetical protein [Candidatus Synoicihabitans palmerolidicus]
MKSTVLASFLAAIALFFWGFIYYSVSGVPDKSLKSPSSDVGPALNNAFPESGTYFVPGMANDKVAIELMARGPVAMVHIQKQGISVMSPSLMVLGFLHGWVYCLLLAILLRQICKKSGYFARVGFVTLVATAGAFMARFGDVIWWHKSLDWQVSEFAYAVIGAALAGLILATFIRSPIKA